MLIDVDGNVVFSLHDGPELGVNLFDAPYRNSGLAVGFRQVMTFLHVDLTRFTPHGTVPGDMAAFAIAPILRNGRAIGALALQVNLSTLMHVVADRSGLGQSGETVLGFEEGEEIHYIVSQAPHYTTPVFMRASEAGASAPMRRALAGKQGGGVALDLRGVEVAASWHFLPALGWGMVVKTDTWEAFAPLHNRQRITMLAFLGFLLLSSAAALIVGRRFVRSEAIIADQEARYRAMFDNMNDGVALYRPTADGQEFQILDVNPAAERIVGQARGELLGKRSRDAFPGLQDAGIFDAFLRVSRSGRNESVSLATYHDTHARLWVENDVIRLPGGEILSVFQDITARKQAEEALLLYARIFEHSGEAIMVTDHDNRIVAINPAFTRQTGYRLEDIAGQDPRILASGRTPRETYHALWQALGESGYWQGEMWDQNRAGHIYPKWAAISVIRDPDGQISNYIASFTDISERKAAEQRIEHLAHHDSLTGLFNRYNLEIRLAQSVLAARREHIRLAVMFIDLDRFKIINDTLGHHTGDLLLVEVAARLRQCVRESDIVARLGGDEFVVVLTRLLDAGDASAVAAKILETLGTPYEINGDRLHTSPSIGISVYPEDGDDAGTLMRNADAAMYHAKEQGRNNLQYFTSALNAAAAERLTLERELRIAVEERQFELHYQPQYAAGADPRERPCGVEALVRWRHPQKGLVPPVRFIPVAEETGLIGVIGDWVLDCACRDFAAWKAAGIAPRRVAVNLSAHQLRNPALVDNVGAVLARHGLRQGELELEITESVAMSDPAGAIEKLQALRALGVDLAIDDFGTGYSSLVYLKRLPIQVLKLDREFVRDIESDANDAAISVATLTLAHSLGLQVVAEGVETEAQRDFLVSHGCDMLQGYLLGRPEPAAVLEQRWRAQD
ncbi:EAL domain-containing protein [Pseudothauera nasutitermitis]|uniref:EAL domain-containing protein n=2 Tax=Pseudothauera nasutitermitis TaxID=2565930 RepID=A0A4S4B4V6_9RHOO|nr:EAL domain-containing protein [Pseudothauera nasutitermitis]